MRLTKLYKDFFRCEKTGGLILLACTAFSLLVANSSFQAHYFSLLNTSMAGHTFTHWVNEGLMAFFFLLIGLELEREFYSGELSNVKNALLPFVGALGGMIVPALIYLYFNYGTSTQSGAGIPMATDIAFAIGVLSLLGKRVPASLKIFLTALAVIDDIGAIIVISIFYSNNIAWMYLAVVGIIWMLLFILNRLKFYNLMPYLMGGAAMWYCMMHSGIHASITGVILAFVIPFGDGQENSTSYILQKTLHKPIAFIVLPLFALCNTAIVLGNDPAAIFTTPYSLGILFGLVGGKLIGVVLFCLLAIAAGICALPKELKWGHLIGAGLLAGIGFTMSVFITLLAFKDENIINNAKLSIIVASCIAGVLGFIVLKFVIKKSSRKKED
jgi:Na+:H+ antiporter, NhaA family